MFGFLSRLVAAALLSACFLLSGCDSRDDSAAIRKEAGLPEKPQALEGMSEEDVAKMREFDRLLSMSREEKLQAERGKVEVKGAYVYLNGEWRLQFFIVSDPSKLAIAETGIQQMDGEIQKIKNASLSTTAPRYGVVAICRSADSDLDTPNFSGKLTVTVEGSAVLQTQPFAINCQPPSDSEGYCCIAKPAITIPQLPEAKPADVELKIFEGTLRKEASVVLSGVAVE